MGLSANQARLNVLTARKADLEYRLIMLTNQSQKLATEKAEAISQKAEALQAFCNSYKADGEKDITVEFTNTTEYIEYEKAMSELELADSKLTQEQKSLETEHSAVENEEEQVKKLVESNIKKSFAYFN